MQDLEISLTPSGRLVVEETGGGDASHDDSRVPSLRDAFGESSAEGLLFLATDGLQMQLAPALVFWRDFAKGLFHTLCREGQQAATTWKRLRPPPELRLAVLASEAPPMRGLEYLTVAHLRQLWTELRDLIVARAAADPRGPEGFLQAANPVWHLLGRVTFHLAENKGDPTRPFAFLATYTHQLAAGSRLKHLPLAQALQEYAGNRNQAQLASLLEPVRRAAEQSPLVGEMLRSKALFRPQAWTADQGYRLLKEAPQIEDSGVVLRLPDWWTPRRPTRAQVQVQLGRKPSASLSMDHLLDFAVDVVLDGEPLTNEERRQILESSAGLVLLRGKWIEVDRARLNQALEHWERLRSLQPDGVSFIEGMRLLAGTTVDATDGDQTVTAEWSHVIAGPWLRETLEQLRDPRGVKGCQPGCDLQATLRPYQTDGVKWLWFMHRLGLGACLADDMGLGKTIQVIDLLLQLKRELSKVASRRSARKSAPAGGRATSLLVVPASLVGNWKDEFARFAPGLRVFYAHRSECSDEALQRMAQAPDRQTAAYDAVVTTYGLVRRMSWLSSVAWRLVILDEAQAIKTPSAAQTRAVKKLDAAGRVVLTGTPVENHLGDLWSVFDFCCPGLLGTAREFKAFVQRVDKQQDAAKLGRLRRLVQPYILRRMKTDPRIVPDLPDKTEMRAECGLSKKQATLYERTVRDLKRKLSETDGMARRGLVLSVLMQLKQICNHPALYLSETEYSPQHSGKFQRLTQICEPIADRQERMLVFTQFQSLTSPLADYLETVFGRKGLVLHGGTPVRKRQQLVREFQREDGPPFFVISVKAGGSGLNLTAASHVVHFDRWWNPAVENQATDRAFRIGQKRNVLVHKFVCRGTVEEQIDQMLRDKQAVADQILEGGGETRLTEMQDEELLQFVSLDLNRATAAD